MRVQPASPGASSTCQLITPGSDEPFPGSLSNWGDDQARTLTSEMNAESYSIRYFGHL
jgi:hypothetical protein